MYQKDVFNIAIPFQDCSQLLGACTQAWLLSSACSCRKWQCRRGFAPGYIHLLILVSIPGQIILEKWDED